MHSISRTLAFALVLCSFVLGDSFVSEVIAAPAGKTSTRASSSRNKTKSRSKLKTAAELAAEVDEMLKALWAEEFIEATETTSDELLLRRLSLDVRGVIPHTEEIERFVADRDKNKLSKWAGWFLDSPDYADYFSEVWEHILLGRRGDSDGLDREGFRKWLRRAFLTGTPYDEIARNLLSSEGVPEDNAAVNFMLRFGSRDPQEMATDLAARVSRVFLGTRIECAQCHDHP
ncbi:MAG: DUF1549 domain-containing protein, partial [Planctomycetota bacterium]